MENYPQSKRNINGRLEQKTKADRDIARKFSKDFFDGNRKHGYGGYSYNERFWKDVIPDFIEYYKLDEDSKVLDIGCAKGFMLYDLKKALPKLEVRGIDISEYAISYAREGMQNYLEIGNAKKLPYSDNSFDLVISVTTLHNLNREDMKLALKEIMRVTKKDAFITLDAYSDEKEKKAMEAWNLTALTMMHTDEWKVFFEESGYCGDYYWFKP